MKYFLYSLVWLFISLSAYADPGHHNPQDAKLFFQKVHFLSQALMKNCVRTAPQEPAQVFYTSLEFNPFKGQKIKGLAWPCKDFEYILTRLRLHHENSDALERTFNLIRTEEFQKNSEEVAHRAVAQCIIQHPNKEDTKSLKMCVAPYNQQDSGKEVLSFIKEL